MKANSPQITLAIESAIAGGSISLLRDGIEIANWTGTSYVSKAEELLVNIDELLTTNGIAKQDIGLIAVSAGPGSFTGIRIGIATALGLKTGLGTAMASESALRAIAFQQQDNNNIIVGVPMGRNAVCLQSFQKRDGALRDLDEPKTLPESDFFSSVESTGSNVVLHQALFERTEPRPNVLNFGSNIAHAIGMICRREPGVVTDPLFISKSF
jgi:tRNA threonylcarbamoyl adenosine modification protein YeaZ